MKKGNFSHRNPSRARWKSLLIKRSVVVFSIKWSIFSRASTLNKKKKKFNQSFSRFSLFTPNSINFNCVKKNEILAEEHLAELMPIFEQLRAQGDLPCTYPLHVSSFGTAFIRGGSRSTPLSPHAPHCHPATHWVSSSTVEPSLAGRMRNILVSIWFAGEILNPSSSSDGNPKIFPSVSKRKWTMQDKESKFFQPFPYEKFIERSKGHEPFLIRFWGKLH